MDVTGNEDTGEPVDSIGGVVVDTSLVIGDEAPLPERNGIASRPERRYQGEKLNADFFFDEFSSEFSVEFTSTFLLSRFSVANSLSAV